MEKAAELNITDYTKKKLPTYIFDVEALKSLKEDILLDIFTKEIFFVAFLASITDVDNRLAALGFIQNDRGLYIHDSGFSLHVLLYSSKQFGKGYYISTLNYPNLIKRMSWNFDSNCIIDVSYQLSDPKYLFGDKMTTFEYTVNLNEKTYEIISINHTSNYFDGKAIELYSKDITPNAVERFNCNIHRIEENTFKSVSIDNVAFENVSIFDVLYLFTYDPIRVHYLTLSSIIKNCGFSVERMLGTSIEQFMDISDIFTPDELKVIEMTYI